MTATRYSKLGETLQYELGTGGKKTWLTYTHDESTRRLTRMRLDRESAAATDLDLNYTYDAVGNITKIAEQAERPGHAVLQAMTICAA